MPGHDSGWAWFDLPPRETESRLRTSGISSDLLNAYVRTFRSEAGKKVIVHLREITVDRIIGPNSSESFLRHIEGQRQLVNYISSLAFGDIYRAKKFNASLINSEERIMETNDD